eukprot:jgi/Ulvmu1/8071/UM004_0308.1
MSRRNKLKLPASVHWLAVLCAFAARQQPTAAAPIIDTVNVKQPSLTNFDIEPDFELSWAPGDLPQPGTEISCRLLRDGEVIASSSFPAFEESDYEDGSSTLVSTGSCGTFQTGKTGRSSILLQLAFDDTFQDAAEYDFSVRVIPGAVTILPPLVAVGMAIATRDVLPSLFCGIWIAAFLVHSYDPFRGFLRTLDTYIIESFASTDHIFVILFSWFLSGLTGLIQRGGGAQGLADAIVGFAKTRRSTMAVAFACGIMIFFDDYANTLIVGSTFRPIMDTLFISREKLAFLVDATSAPIASISPISSWVGYELSQIESSYEALKDDGFALDGWETSPFLIFVRTIPGRFYPIAMLCLQLLLILTQRDFGPMLQAERRAHTEGKIYADTADKEQVSVDEKLQSKVGVPSRWFNAVIPIALVVFLVLLGLLLTGRDAVEADGLDMSIQNIFGNGDPFSSLLWATFFVSLVTWGLFRIQYHHDGVVQPFWSKHKDAKPFMTLSESEDTWIEGIKQLVSTTLVLILAWAIGDAMRAVGTDVFIASGVSSGIDKRAIPVLVFILSAFIAASTGTSWGTMAIMFPVATRSVAAAGGDEALMLATIASILSGSVWGDHCSPLSDTTILSSLASRCDLMHHVRTQAPYALLVGLISIITGDLMSGFLYPDWAGLLITIAATLVAGFLLSAPTDSSRQDPISFVMDKASAACSGLTSRCGGRGAVNSQESDEGDQKLRDANGKVSDHGV